MGVPDDDVGTMVSGVATVRWPAEGAAPGRAGRGGDPPAGPRRLGAEPPAPLDAVEDWMWEWADDGRAPGPGRHRARPLARRRRGPAPRADADGRIHVGDRSATLAPRVAAVARVLVARFDEVVARDELVAAAWPDRSVGDGAVPLVLHRLRQRVAPLGLAVTSVRGRGVALVWTTGATTS